MIRGPSRARHDIRERNARTQVTRGLPLLRWRSVWHSCTGKSMHGSLAETPPAWRRDGATSCTCAS